MLSSKHNMPGLPDTTETAKLLAPNDQSAKVQLPNCVQLFQSCCIWSKLFTAFQHRKQAMALPWSWHINMALTSAKHEHCRIAWRGTADYSTPLPSLHPTAQTDFCIQLWYADNQMWNWTHWSQLFRGWKNYQECNIVCEVIKNCSSLSLSNSRQISDDSEPGVKKKMSVPAKGQISVSLLLWTTAETDLRPSFCSEEVILMLLHYQNYSTIHVPTVPPNPSHCYHYKYWTN